MIQENELRIGNWVKCADKYVKVESIYDQGINLQIEARYYGAWEENLVWYFKNNWYGNSLIEPVPLTPEILEKCNTTKSNNTFRTKIKDEYFSYFDKNNRIMYLHQWQNIVYALTGEELNVNL